MRRLVLLLSVLLPAWVGAQTFELTIDGQNRRAYNASACEAEVPVQYSVTPTGTPCGDITFWVTGASCGDEPNVTNDHVLSTSVPFAELVVGTNKTGTVRFPIRQLPIFKTTNTCGEAIESADHTVCARYKVRDLATSQCDVFQRATTTVAVVYDGVPPPKPWVTLDARDSALAATAAGEEAVTFVFEYRAVGATDYIRGARASAQSPHTEIRGLENDVPYEVRVFSEDEAGNVSEPSDPVQGTPIETYGAFEALIRGGSAERGGCAAVPGESMTLLGLLACCLAWRGRYRR